MAAKPRPSRQVSNIICYPRSMFKWSVDESSTPRYWLAEDHDCVLKIVEVDPFKFEWSMEYGELSASGDAVTFGRAQQVSELAALAAGMRVSRTRYVYSDLAVDEKAARAIQVSRYCYAVPVSKAQVCLRHATSIHRAAKKTGLSPQITALVMRYCAWWVGIRSRTAARKREECERIEANLPLIRVNGERCVVIPSTWISRYIQEAGWEYRSFLPPNHTDKDTVRLIQQKRPL